MAENPEKDRCSERPHASSSEEPSAWNPVQVPGRDGFEGSRPGNVQPSGGGSTSESDARQPKIGEPQASLQDSAADSGVTNTPPTSQEPGAPQNSWAQPQQPTSDLNHTQMPGQNDQLLVSVRSLPGLGAGFERCGFRQAAHGAHPNHCCKRVRSCFAHYRRRCAQHSRPRLRGACLEECEAYCGV